MTKEKLCKACKIPFIKSRPMQRVCSPACALIELKEKKRKDFNKETRQMKLAAKSKSDYIKEAQVVFNKFIRLRDAKEPCISCGRHHQGQYQAGHYKSVGGYPELRFEELNVHKQCSACNDGNKLSGNIHEYRKGLIKKIGTEKVEWLEGPHDPIKLTIDDAVAIKKKYSKRVRVLSDGL